MAISDVQTLVVACSGPNSQAIIDAMWAYAHEMIPDVTSALDNVDPTVTHLEPHTAQGALTRLSVKRPSSQQRSRDSEFGIDGGGTDRFG